MNDYVAPKERPSLNDDAINDIRCWAKILDESDENARNRRRASDILDAIESLDRAGALRLECLDTLERVRRNALALVNLQGLCQMCVQSIRDEIWMIAEARIKEHNAYLEECRRNKRAWQEQQRYKQQGEKE